MRRKTWGSARRHRRRSYPPWVPMVALIGLGAAGLYVFGSPSIVFIDRDCADFSTEAEAQKFFKSQGPGDPHRLDDDNDGRACEALP